MALWPYKQNAPDALFLNSALSRVKLQIRVAPLEDLDGANWYLARFQLTADFSQ
jgi:hypothetical protein